MFRPTPDIFRRLAATVICQAVADIQRFERTWCVPVDTNNRRRAFNSDLKAAKLALLWISRSSSGFGVSFADCAEAMGCDANVARWKLLDRFDPEAIDALERAVRIDKRCGPGKGANSSRTLVAVLA